MIANYKGFSILYKKVDTGMPGSWWITYSLEILMMSNFNREKKQIL